MRSFTSWQVAIANRNVAVSNWFEFCVCVYVCGYGVHFGPYGQFGGLFHFSCSVVVYILCFSVFLGRCDRVAGHVPHIDRVLLGVRRYRSKVTGVCPAPFKAKPGFRAQVGLLVGKFSTYIRIYTAGKLGLYRCDLCTEKLTTIIIHQAGDGRH